MLAFNDSLLGFKDLVLGTNDLLFRLSFHLVVTVLSRLLMSYSERKSTLDNHCFEHNSIIGIAFNDTSTFRVILNSH